VDRPGDRFLAGPELSLKQDVGAGACRQFNLPLQPLAGGCVSAQDSASGEFQKFLRREALNACNACVRHERMDYYEMP
jgi:hypothetical protein